MNAFFVVLSLLMKEALSLRMTNLTVPAYRLSGEEAQLECNYELEDDGLFAVKWYLDDVEFYRFNPSDIPRRKVFVVKGIDVDLRKSNDKNVTLKEVTLEAAGLYRCEVSGGAPTFNTASGEGRMEVIYLPREPPQITRRPRDHRPGNTLLFNCTSGKSYPAATLSWDIDGENITDSDSLIEYPPIRHSGGLVSTTLGLQVPFYGGIMRARCIARVSVYGQKSSETVVDEKTEVQITLRSAAEASTFTATRLILSFALLGALNKLLTC